MVLRGCYVAVVTPFHENGTVNEKALRSHIDFLIGKGVAGIVPCGTTGESATFRGKSTTMSLMWRCEQAQGQDSGYPGAGSNNTAESLAAARHALETGRRRDPVHHPLLQPAHTGRTLSSTSKRSPRRWISRSSFTTYRRGPG